MELYYLMTILDRDKEKNIVSIYKEHETTLILTFLAHGTATHEILDIHGLEETKKAMVVTIVNKEHADVIFKDAKKRMMVDIPGNGIMLSVPVKSVGGSRTLAFISNEAQMDKKVPEMKFDYELVIVILNKGYTDVVMDAARDAGAQGGTVISAKGTGTEYAQKFLDVYLAAEKEVLLIAATSKHKEEIMRHVREKAGPDTPCGAISLSLPISSIVGIRHLEEDEEEVAPMN